GDAAPERVHGHARRRQLEGAAEGDVAARELDTGGDREGGRVHRVGRLPLHDRFHRVDRRRDHRMTIEMLDDARSLWEVIERRATLTPDRVMLYDGDRVTTFSEYKALVERAAAGMHALGIGSDDHVSWQLPTWTESAVLVGALARLGAIQNPMLPIYRYREVSFIAEQTHCKLLITPSTWNKFDYAALAPQVAGENAGTHPPVADPWNPAGDPSSLPPAPAVFDDPADDPVRWVFYTSGTTAAPKGAQHTDRSALAGAIGYAEKTHVVADDIAL